MPGELRNAHYKFYNKRYSKDEIQTYANDNGLIIALEACDKLISAGLDGFSRWRDSLEH